jgi:hypothetical protein
MIPTPKLNTSQRSSPQTVPPPIGGLNGRDPLAAMGKSDAYLLDNFLPGTSDLKSRKGHAKYSTTALTGPVQSLEVYSGGAADQMLAWAGGSLYNVSVAAPALLVSGLLSNTVVTTMFSNSADNSQHLMITSGLDTPSRFDGTAITNLALTGMVGSSSTLNFVFAFKSRLYWGQKDKLGFYYLPVGALQGALSYFDLAQVSKLGGYLVAIASYSEDSGNGPNDYIVFITSKGECIVYAGFDPSNANNWTIVGRYYAAVPIGKKCVLNYGSELILLTLEGALPFSQIRKAGDAKSAGVAGSSYSALTSKLGSFLSDYNINAATPGWQGLQYSGAGGWLLLNVPATSLVSGKYYHYVMNTTTNAWSRITNWNGLCFTVFNKRLFFGRYDGYVMLGDEGRLDDGQSILCDAKQAYNYFEDGNGLGFLQKHFQWASLLVGCDGKPPLSGKFNVDYVEESPTYLNEVAGVVGSPWDDTFWDVGSWGGDNQTQRFVVTLNKGGVAGSLWLRASLSSVSFSWYATQYIIEKTRGLLI